MTEELVLHVEANDELFKTWIDDNQRLQIGMAVLEPLIPEFLKEFPEVNLKGNCHECIIDMLRWARGEVKKLRNPQEKKNGK